jgi:hypothetical protein
MASISRLAVSNSIAAHTSTAISADNATHPSTGSSFLKKGKSFPPARSLVCGLEITVRSEFQAPENRAATALQQKLPDF